MGLLTPLRATRASPVLARTLIRSLSSIPQPPSSTVKTRLEKSLPPEPPISRKTRVELRPGPLKFLDTARPSVGPSAVLSKTLRVNKNAQSPSSPPVSVSETTKRDFEDATSHGILKPPPPNANRLRRLMHQAIELIKFYWRGLKMINTNRKHVSAIKERVRAGGSPLSRWESRFMRTYRQDTLKLVPFAIIVILLEEIIPLIAIYAPFMLPSTCILPSQRDRIESAKRAKQAAYATNNRSLFRHLSSAESGQVPLAVLRGNPALIEAMCGILRLSSFGFDAMRLWRIRHHLLYISRDDGQLVNEDMGAGLSPSEVTEALLERGIVATHLSEKAQATQLKQWLTSTHISNEFDPVSRRIYVMAKNASGH